MFAKIEDYTLSERVTQHNQQMIVSNQLRPGDKLPAERILCEELGVSRTVVREAVRGLVTKGLLAVTPGRAGTIVRYPTAEQTTESMMLYLSAGRGGVDYAQVIEVRRVIEVGIAGLAAIRRTEEDLQRLAALLQPPSLTDENAELLFMENDQNFHEALAHATHNPFFVLLMESIREWMLELRRRAAQAVRRAPSITKHHWEIFEQIKAGNVLGAQQAMIAHLNEAEAIQRAALQLQQ